MSYGVTRPQWVNTIQYAAALHMAQKKCTLQWRHNERDGVSNHRRLHCLLNCCFRRRSKKTSKIRVIGLCAGNSPVTGEFPEQKVTNAKNISIWWRYYEKYTPDVEFTKHTHTSTCWMSHGVSLARFCRETIVLQWRHCFMLFFSAFYSAV